MNIDSKIKYWNFFNIRPNNKLKELNTLFQRILQICRAKWPKFPKRIRETKNKTKKNKNAEPPGLIR